MSVWDEGTERHEPQSTDQVMIDKAELMGRTVTMAVIGASCDG